MSEENDYMQEQRRQIVKSVLPELNMEDEEADKFIENLGKFIDVDFELDVR